MKKGEGININQIIEKYRIIIGGLLVVVILVGCAILIYRGKNEEKNDQNNNLEYRNDIENLENKIVGLENKIEEIKNNQQTQSINQSTAEGDTGQVAGASTETTKNSDYVSAKINLNTASSAQLDTLPGIGPAYASRIIDYRNANGGFKDISEIQNVKGIGPKTFEKLKDLITVN